MKVLIALTTYNHVEITRKCMEYAMDLPHDIIVVDDCSTDGTLQYLAELKVSVITKKKRLGLTDSWNRAYKHFKGSDYTHLILSNNDVLFPVGAIEAMVSDRLLTTPMCNYSGAGYVNKGQAIDFYHDLRWIDPIQAANVQRVQDDIKGEPEFRRIAGWTGFCMCMSRGIIDKEYPGGNLFNPTNINVGNDDDINQRVGCYIATRSFVYHYKGVSFDGKMRRKDRDDIR